jgi:hypothetical protein
MNEIYECTKSISQIMNNKTILLLTDITNKRGIKPSLQDLDYWKSSGYTHHAYETGCAITLSKKPMTLDFHCGYFESHNIIKIKQKP